MKVKGVSEALVQAVGHGREEEKHLFSLEGGLALQNFLEMLSVNFQTPPSLPSHSWAAC